MFWPKPNVEILLPIWSRVIEDEKSDYKDSEQDFLKTKPKAENLE